MDHETDRPHTAAGARRSARPRSTGLLSAVLLAAGLVLTACAGGDGDGDDGSGRTSSDGGVASLVTPSPGGGSRGADPSARSSAAADEARRPVLRLDSSQEEIDRLWDGYWACLQARGVPMNTGRVEHPGEQAPPAQDVADQYKKQYEACRYKMPLQPVEERPETNPHYADDYRAYVKCLNSKGLKVHEVFKPDGSPDGWTYDDDFTGAGDSPAFRKTDNDCRLEAFGGKGKK
ncbi:hypothetical protein ACIQFU_24745 [Streptomyces sp. NPDC093065]|uniref:hypothetical protein n=1 Tax=Streptomyces sp. NPDC093065 TaxID=3366021 RepID=UPI0038235D26